MTTYRLTISVMEATGLRAADSGGTSDPYCKVRISGRDEVWKTKVLKKNLNPQWQETFEIPGVSLNDTLLLQVFDHDAGLFGTKSNKDGDALGEVTVQLQALADLLQKRIATGTFPLTGQQAKGNLAIGFSFNPPIQPATPTGAGEAAAVAQGAAPQAPALASGATAPHLSTAASVLSMNSCKVLPRTFLELPNLPREGAGSYTARVHFYGQELNREPTYRAGSTIKGAVVLVVYEPFLDVRRVGATFSGKKKSWTYLGMDKVVKNDIVREKVPLIETDPAHGVRHTRLMRGKHVLPFEIWLPAQMPSSVKKAPANKPYIEIKYKVVTDIDIVAGEDTTIKSFVKVCNPKDLPTANEDWAPGPRVKISKSQMGAFGSISLEANTVRAGYAPWEDIELDLTITNESARKIKNIKVDLELVPIENGIKCTKTELFTWRKKLFPYCFPKTTVRNTLVFELSDVTRELPMSYTEGNYEIYYQLDVTADVPMASDVSLKVPVRILASERAARPVTAEVRTQAELQSLSEKPHASHWHAKDVQTWLVHKVDLSAYVPMLEELQLTGAELLMLHPNDLYYIAAMFPEHRDRFLQAIEALVRSSTTLVRDPSSWGTRELSVWLQYTAFLPQYIATVEARRLTGKDLLGMSLQALQALAQTSPDHAALFRERVTALLRPWVLSSLPDDPLVWGPSQVQVWALYKLGLPQFVPYFQAKHTTGIDLLWQGVTDEINTGLPQEELLKEAVHNLILHQWVTKIPALPYDWTVEHVILWVRFVLRLPAYVSIVKHRQIDGAELINMTSAELNALAAFSPTDAEALVAGVQGLVKRFHLPVALLKHLGLSEHTVNFTKNGVVSEDLFRLTEYELGLLGFGLAAKKRVRAAVLRMQEGQLSEEAVLYGA